MPPWGKLIDPGDEPVGMPHVMLVFLAKKKNTFSLISSGCHDNRCCSQECHHCTSPRNVFKEYPPSQQEKGTVHRVADVMEYPSGNQAGRLLESDQVGFIFLSCTGLTMFAKCMDPQNERYKTDAKQDPGDRLVPGEWLVEPAINIQQEQREDIFEGEKAVETVGVPQ